MRPIRPFLEPLLAGKPLETGPATALSTVVWVLRRRLEEFDSEVWRKPDADTYESLFQRRLQLLEDIEAVEALLARAEGKRLFETPGPPRPAPGHGYGET